MCGIWFFFFLYYMAFRIYCQEIPVAWGMGHGACSMELGAESGEQRAESKLY